MTEREVGLAALFTALGAVLARPFPVWSAVLAVAVAAVARRPAIVMVALMVVSSVAAARASAGVDLPGPGGNVRSTAEVVTEPRSRPGGLMIEVRVDGRRYQSFVGGEAGSSLERVTVGERFAVIGRTAPMDAPWAWMASRHLAGRLRIDDVGPVLPAAWWWRSANRVHREVSDGVASFVPADRALFLGVVLGDDRDQSEVDRHRFRASGLAHLLAVSGQNVAFVLVVAAPALSRLTLRWRWGLTGAVLVAFALVTRLEPSVLRAVAMAMVAATASWRGRYASGIRIVGVAVILLLLIDPLLVWSVGFRLSVAASIALVTLARPLADRLPGPRLLADALGVSLAAQLATAPLLVVMAGSVPMLGPVFNLAAVPVAGWLMVWGVVTGPLAGVVGEPIAAFLGWPSIGMVRWLALVARVGASPAWPRLGPLGVASMTLGVVVWLAWPWLLERASAVGSALGSAVRPVLAAAMVAVGVDAAGVAVRPTTTGDGAVRLWRAGDGGVLVVGPRSTERSALDAMTAARCSRLDVVVVTGGGLVSSQIVLTLREVTDVGAVVAADPATIRDAGALVTGTIAVGDLHVEVSEHDGRWSVERSS